MAILAKCAKCKRLGGYARTANSTMCARCEDKYAHQDKANANKKD